MIPFPVKKVMLFYKEVDVYLGAYGWKPYVSQGFESPGYTDSAGKYHDYQTLQGTPTHGAWDIPMAYWREIPAMSWGRVERAERQIALNGVDYGNVIIVVYPALALRVLYRHMDENLVSVGQEFVAEQTLGLAGSTGFSTAVHTHVEFYPIDANGNLRYPNNGYAGRVDPAGYYDTMYELYTRDGKQMWLVRDGIRKWVLDPGTLERMRGDIKNTSPIVDPYLRTKFAYGGALFVSDTDDPEYSGS